MKFPEKMSNITREEYDKMLNRYPYNVKGHWIRKFPYEFWKYLKYISHNDYCELLEKTRNKENLSMDEIKTILNDIAKKHNNKELIKHLKEM